MPFRIIRNDITKVSADAIVNSANPRPEIGGGCEGAIYRAAGAMQLLREREIIGDIACGETAVTKAFDLQAEYIIHTVGPVWEDGNHGELSMLKACYENSMNRALELGCKSIAFPLISSGTYGFPKDKALQIAMTVLQSYAIEHNIMIWLVVFNAASFTLSGKIFGDIQAFVDDNYVEQAEKSEYSIRNSARRKQQRIREEQEKMPQNSESPAFPENKFSAADEEYSAPSGNISPSPANREYSAPSGNISPSPANREYSAPSGNFSPAAPNQNYSAPSGNSSPARVNDDDSVLSENRCVSPSYAESDFEYKASVPPSASRKETAGKKPFGFLWKQPRKPAEDLISATYNPKELTFQETLFSYIIDSGLSNSAIYKSIDMSRQTFSKIQCDRDYQPTKHTAIMFCLALKLNLEQSEDLLSRAGFSLNPCKKSDMIIKGCLVHGEYDFNEIELLLIKNNCPTLFKNTPVQAAG